MTPISGEILLGVATVASIVYIVSLFGFSIKVLWEELRELDYVY